MLRDEKYIAGMTETLNLFRVELDMLNHRLREMGDHESAKSVTATYRNVYETVAAYIDNYNTQQ